MPAYDPIDPKYWDEQDLRSEIERVAKLCADCRLCNKFCGSFPKLFDAIDSYCTEEQYATVDAAKLKGEDVKTVVDLCFQCKLCDINCPYTPGNHEWAIDFPRLMARAKAQRVKKNGVPLVDKMLGNPDLVGKLASWMAPIANWANESKIHRQFMQGVIGIHKDKTLPPFHWTTFASRFRSSWKNPTEEPTAKIAFFSTCFVNYNAPDIGMDTLHDGAWAMKKENFVASLKWGGKAFRGINEAEPDVTCSDCPLAAIQIQQGTGRKPLNPIEILAKSYRGEQIIGADQVKKS